MASKISVLNGGVEKFAKLIPFPKAESTGNLLCRYVGSSKSGVQRSRVWVAVLKLSLKGHFIFVGCLHLNLARALLLNKSIRKCY